LGVNPASVTGALGVLSGKGLINYAPYEAITLTPQGKKVSRDVVRRHEVLRSFFLNILSVDRDIADRAACSMEHALSREILDRLTQFLDFVERNPHCLEDFQHDPAQGAREKKK
jgi:DtxR family Mn-dependent transcriptional regulator